MWVFLSPGRTRCLYFVSDRHILYSNLHTLHSGVAKVWDKQNYCLHNISKPAAGQSGCWPPPLIPGHNASPDRYLHFDIKLYVLSASLFLSLYSVRRQRNNTVRIYVNKNTVETTTWVWRFFYSSSLKRVVQKHVTIHFLQSGVYNNFNPYREEGILVVTDSYDCGFNNFYALSALRIFTSIQTL